MKRLLDKIRNAESIAAFTGAGVSTLCGIPDFRGPQGLYKNPDAERSFDIDCFSRDPSIYYKGCRELVYGLRNYKLYLREVERGEPYGYRNQIDMAVLPAACLKTRYCLTAM